MSKLEKLITVFSPSPEIRETQLCFFLDSAKENNYVVDTASTVEPANYLIQANEYKGRRDYFKIENIYRVFKDTYEGMFCAVDVDTLIAKPIKFMDVDFDIAFTQRQPYLSKVHPLNLGVCFVNVTRNNREKLDWFIRSWLNDVKKLDRDSEGSVVYWNYMNLPEIVGHKEFSFDRIVQQDYPCALAHHYGWREGDNIYKGLRVRVLDYRYNLPWYLEDPVDSRIYIYHFKGQRESKLDRAIKCKYKLKEYLETKDEQS